MSQKLADAMQLQGGVKFFAVFVAALALTTALAAITYHLVERPMIRLGERLLAARRTLPTNPSLMEQKLA